MINFAVFDMAGTTVADKDFVANAFRHAFWKQDIKVEDWQVNPLMGYPKPMAIQMVLEHLGIDADEELVQTIHAEFVKEMLSFYQHSPFVQAMPHAEDLFFYLQERGVPIALNTGFSKDIAEVIVSRFRWLERGLINDFIASDEVENGRPHPDMIHRLKERNNISSNAVVMKVGDTVVDILEGQNAGCKYVMAVTTGASPREELQQYQPTHIISNLSEVPAILKQAVQAYV